MINDKVNSKMLFFSKMSKELYDSMIEKEAKRCGISRQEAHVLLFFSNNCEFSSAKDAVIYRGFSKSYVSKALSILEKRGFVKIENDDNDRRYQHIIINDSAKGILEQLRAVQKEYFLILKEGISEEDFLVHVKVIDKIADNVLNKMKG